MLLLSVIIAGLSISQLKAQNNADKVQNTVQAKLSDTTDLLPLPRHGKFFLIPGLNPQLVSKRSLVWNDYTEFPDIVYSYVPVYPMSLGSFGQFNSYSQFGSMPNGNAIAFDGRTMSDFSTSMFDLTEISPEMAESFEFFSGSDAVILGDNSTGSFVNIQEARYDTRKPFTRLWMGQAGFDFVSVDGTLSQNFAKGWNGMLGFRSQSQRGRFLDQWYETWNLRANLHYKLSELTNISFYEYFTNHGYGTNGGSDPAASTDIYSTIDASPYYSYLNKRTFRHDLTMKFSSYLDSDSLNAVSASLFYSVSKKLLNTQSEFYINSDSLFNFNESYLGGNVSYETFIENTIGFKTGGEAKVISLDKSFFNDEYSGLAFSAFGLLTLSLPGNITLSGGTRFNERFGRTVLNVGSRIKFNFNDSTDLYFDYSVSSRIPTPFPGIELKQELHNLFIAAFDYHNSDFSAEITTSFRHVDDPEQAVYVIDTVPKLSLVENSLSQNYIGASARISGILFDLLNYDFNAQFNSLSAGGEQLKQFPAFYSNFAIYYTYLVGRSVLKAGLKSGFISNQSNMSYDPVFNFYYQTDAASGFRYTGLDVFADLKLGSAFVRLTMQNIFSSGYYYIAYYPQLNLNFRMTVSWTFN